MSEVQEQINDAAKHAVEQGNKPVALTLNVATFNAIMPDLDPFSLLFREGDYFIETPSGELKFKIEEIDSALSIEVEVEPEPAAE